MLQFAKNTENDSFNNNYNFKKGNKYHEITLNCINTCSKWTLNIKSHTKKQTYENYFYGNAVTKASKIPFKINKNNSVELKEILPISKDAMLKKSRFNDRNDNVNRLSVAEEFDLNSAPTSFKFISLDYSCFDFNFSFNVNTRLFKLFNHSQQYTKIILSKKVLN